MLDLSSLLRVLTDDVDASDSRARFDNDDDAVVLTNGLRGSETPSMPGAPTMEAFGLTNKAGNEISVSSMSCIISRFIEVAAMVRSNTSHLAAARPSVLLTPMCMIRSSCFSRPPNKIPYPPPMLYGAWSRSKMPSLVGLTTRLPRAPGQTD